MTSRQGLPVLVQRDHGEGTTLERLPFSAGFSEDWLQGVLHWTPHVLPIEHIDERLELPLTSLGREIPVDNGTIDNLFIGRNGQLVIVETKLWRNPEARRSVVAQVLDYAARVRRWRYEDVDRAAQREHDKSLFQLVDPEAEEHVWVDRVCLALRKGRMTLLVVGDGIREDAQDLVDTLSAHPDFEFRLALIELRVYRHPNGDRLVVPSVLMKTAEIVRAVVQVEYGTGGSVQVGVTTPAERPSVRREVLTEEAFLDLLREANNQERVDTARNFLGLVQSPLEPIWSTRSLNIKMRDPVSSRLLSLMTLPAEGKPYFYVQWLRDQLMPSHTPDTVQQVIDAHARLFERFGARPSSATNPSYALDLANLSGREHEFIAGLMETAARIEALAKKSGHPHA